MEKTAVICDAGPLISIACSDGFHWLRGLFGSVALTPSVIGEVLVQGKPGVSKIDEAIKAGWLRVLTDDPQPPPILARYDLDQGELSSIAAAYYLRPDCLLIVDEIKARKAAKELCVPAIGTAGLLIEAKEARLIVSCGDELGNLIENGFYISRSVTQSVLAKAGESLEMSARLKNLFS